MKKLITIVAAIFITSAAFSQEKNQGTAAVKPTHECYMMKEGAVMHCTGDKAVAITSKVTLKSGTVIMPDGTVKVKDGEETKLENGQCISLMGGIGDCGKMHASMKDEHSAPSEK